MINRTMVRTRVVQTLFAYYQNPDKTGITARKELNKSFADTYDLYFVLLDFVNELTAYAQKQLEEQMTRARATHADWTRIVALRRIVWRSSCLTTVLYARVFRSSDWYGIAA